MRWIRRIALAAASLAGAGGLGLSALVGYAVFTTDDRMRFPDTPYPEITASTDPEVIARGRYLVRGPAHCSQCHSVDDRARFAEVTTAPMSGGVAFDMSPIAVRYAANLTPAGGLTDAEIARAVRTGVTHSGELSIFMRYVSSKPSDEDLVAIVSYLRSLDPAGEPAPPGTVSLFGEVVLAYAMPRMEPATEVPRHVPASDTPSVARGQYLAENIALCTYCHTAFSGGFEPDGPRAGGGLPEPSHGEDTRMEFVAPNLTSHPTGITGRVSEEAFVARMAAGRVFPTSLMPWENFSLMSEADARSIYRYLSTLPPVDNDVGPTYRPVGWTPGDSPHAVSQNDGTGSHPG